jgi:hypothetical protein
MAWSGGGVVGGKEDECIGLGEHDDGAAAFFVFAGPMLLDDDDDHQRREAAARRRKRPRLSSRICWLLA